MPRITATVTGDVIADVRVERDDTTGAPHMWADADGDFLLVVKDDAEIVLVPRDSVVEES